MKKWMLWLAAALFVYYLVDYKRYFVSSCDGTEFITIWMRANGTCYVVPDKYWSPFSPSEDFIKTVNHRNYIGVLFNTEDEYTMKISIYHKLEVHGLAERVKVYDNGSELRREYGFNYDQLSPDEKAKIKQELIDRYCYKYVDLNRVFGVKVFYE